MDEGEREKRDGIEVYIPSVSYLDNLIDALYWPQAALLPECVVVRCGWGARLDAVIVAQACQPDYKKHAVSCLHAWSPIGLAYSNSACLTWKRGWWVGR